MRFGGVATFSPRRAYNTASGCTIYQSDVHYKFNFLATNDELEANVWYQTLKEQSRSPLLFSQSHQSPVEPCGENCPCFRFGTRSAFEV